MNRTAITVAWLSAMLAVVGFFLPWAHLDLRQPKVVQQLTEQAGVTNTVKDLTRSVGRIAVRLRRGAETVVGDLPTLSDLPKQVSGYQIPQFANQEQAQVAIAIAELLTGARQQIGAKSYAVYLLPGIALLCALLLTVLGEQRLVAAAVALLCAIVAGVGSWKLATVPREALVISIVIGHGLRLSLGAYVGLTLAALLSLVPNRRAS